MTDKEQIVNLAEKGGQVKSGQIARMLGVSRQYAARLLAELVNDGLLRKTGSTRAAVYLPAVSINNAKHVGQKRYIKRLRNKNIEEHLILQNLKTDFPPLNELPENVENVFDYAFLEMINNAIEHSRSKTITVEVSLSKEEISFVVTDAGVGVFKNIKNKLHLPAELDAIGELMKGKVTTAPKLHSGEGIFFTSKTADRFLLESFGWKMAVDNSIHDIFVGETDKSVRGTKVTFSINIKTKRHLTDVFKKFTTSPDDQGAEFDKTEIFVRLFAAGGVHISRSQARRILSGLDKFSVVIMDYDKIPMVGQAFADEIYRVFKNAHPDIRIENVNMNDAVAFMITRAVNMQKK